MTWKAILASGLLVIATYGANYVLDGCEGTDKPKTISIIPATKTGDGIHIVGDEIRPGLWRSPVKWLDMPACVWFVAPAAFPSPSASPSSEPTSTRARVESPGKTFFLRLHEGESLVSANCVSLGDQWEHLQD